MVTGTFIFLMIIIIAVCVLLVLIILSQNPKGGGLSSTFGGGGSQMFGVQRTNDFLDKATWTLSILIVVLVVLSNVMIPRGNQSTLPVPPAPSAVPEAPAGTPPASGQAPFNPQQPVAPIEPAPAQ
ncbi:MAG: preprotein translocase subunit SecG [Weeksellaceae bacterium]|nr:preprotein translocase subunit SecG [Weeksellaceae bacterium]